MSNTKVMIWTRFKKRKEKKPRKTTTQNEIRNWISIILYVQNDKELLGITVYLSLVIMLICMLRC